MLHNVALSPTELGQIQGRLVFPPFITKFYLAVLITLYCYFNGEPFSSHDLLEPWKYRIYVM